MPTDKPPLRLDAALILAGFFAIKLGLHFPFIERYGYHGDELYFIECARHLALGYVDHPPFVPWIARLSGDLFGYHLASLRLFAVLAGAASVPLTVLLAREWGGKRAAQLIAGVTMLIAPAYLQMAAFLNIAVFETFFWTLCAYLITLVIKRHEPKWWIAVGVVAGIGLLNKHTMLLWGLGMAVGLLLTEHRRYLRSPWLWLGVLSAFLIFLPNLIWQGQHEWATLQFIHNIQSGMLAAIPRILFLLGQLLYMHPFSTPIWAAGLVFFFSEAGKPYRVFGWLYLVVFAVLLVPPGKPYYLAPAYPALFAGGAVMLEQMFERRRWKWPVPAILTALLLSGGVTALFALPILPLEEKDAVIQRAFAFAIDDPTMVSGDYHLQYGWPEQAAVVSRVYQSLPAHEQAKTVILTERYSEASAINFFGEAWHLPRAYSGHMTHYLWGPPKSTPEVVIAYGIAPKQLESLCAPIAKMDEIVHPMAMKHESNLPVYVCRPSEKSLRDAWPEFKRYYH
jgi:hypothetical protein